MTILTVTCANCERGFQTNARRGPVPKYCGGACRQAALRIRRLRASEDEDIVKVIVDAIQGEAVTGMEYQTVWLDSYDAEQLAKRAVARLKKRYYVRPRAPD